MIKEALGIRIRDLRNKSGLSQEQFALLIDMDRTYLASVETGKRNISLENIKKIADGFNISLSELFDGVK
ncbi:MAG: helix-turn-helix transcriptional regulator [Ruminococcus sp.]|nr:helix-turn-helix transcriptional regulator [Ruminococcus sp.]